MNNHLTPEKRPDRTGKLVTRWVRSLGIGKQKKALPAPTVVHDFDDEVYESDSFDEYRRVEPKRYPTREERDAKRAELKVAVDRAKEALTSSFISDPEDYEYESSSTGSSLSGNLEFLYEHDPEMFERVIASANSDTRIATFWRKFISGLHHRGYGRSNDEDLTPRIIRRRLSTYVHAFSAINVITNASQTDRELAASDPLHPVIFRTLAASDSIAQNSEHDYTYEQIEAMATYVYVMGEHDNPYFATDHMHSTIYADNADDFEYLASRIAEARGIVPELAVRKSIDKDLVRTLIDSPSKALIEGEL